MIRILHIITGLSVGGAETSLLKLLGAMDSARFEHEVVSLTDLGPISYQIEALGVTVSAMGLPHVSGFPALIGKIHSSKADVVQTWMYHADLLGGVAARLLTTRPIVWNIRNNEISPGLKMFRTRLVMKTCAMLSSIVPAKIISNSIVAKNLHVNQGYNDDKFIIIPNGFDTEKFRPDPRVRLKIRTRLGISESDFLVGYFARLDPLKNHAGFVRACGFLAERIPHLRILMCGKYIDPSNDILMAMLDEAGLAGRVSLLGEQMNMPAYYSAIDTFCLASLSEAFPNVVGEAMACSVPCIVTDVGDSKSILGDGGLVVKAGDDRALSDAILKMSFLSNDERKLMGFYARNRIKSQYSMQSYAIKYEKLYETIIR